jgi:hypothetical protein
VQVERATIEESQNALFKMLQEDPSDTTDVEPEQKHDGDGDDDDRRTPQ